jgi:flagellar L-ring protein precursor FlgH
MKTPLLLCAAITAMAASAPEIKPGSIDEYIARATAAGAAAAPLSPGSLYSPSSYLSDLGRDARASRPDDIVTILVLDRASAVSKGTTKSERTSSANYGIGSLLGNSKAQLADLARLSGNSKLDGQGETSRENVLSTVLSARVSHVLPNGNLVVHGTKTVAVNSETQFIEVRGVLRSADLASDNVIRSDRLAQLEIRVNGKGVVGDAVKRPFILYRILMGLLPF